MNEQFTRAPHHTDRSSAPSPNAALLIDFDNVTMGIRSNLGQELRQLLNSDIIRGKVSVQRAYADWRRYPQYVVPLSEAAIDLIYAPAYGSSKKNATDIRLAIDALELVFTRPEIGTFILLSGDSDFSSLVLKLKEYGKYVIGVGMQESSSDLLVQNCDEYYSYDSLSGLVTADEMDTERHDPWELAEHSIKKMVERDDVMRSDRLKQVMLELDPSFDEKEIGYSKFNRFLTEASSRGILKLQKIGNGQYEVGPGSSVDVEPPSPSGGDGGRGQKQRERREQEEKTEKEDGGAPPPRDLSEAGGEADRQPSSREESGGREESRRQKAARSGDRPVVEAEQLRAAYDLLQEVVSDLSGEEGRVRDSEVKREMLNRDSSFDEAALGFSKFSRFIRQAHDEEVVDITKDSDGNYYLEPVGGAERAAPEPEPDREPEPTPEPEPEASREQEREPAETEPSPEERSDRGADAAPAADEEQPEPESAGEDEEEEAPSREPKKPVGGLRRRRKSKGGDGSGSDDGSWVPGPVDTGGDGGDSTTTTAPTSGTTKESGSGTGRRGLGRFRRGRKSGKGEKDEESGSGPTPGPVSTGSASAGEEGEESAPDTEPESSAAAGTEPSEAGTATTAGDADSGAEEIVQHMKERYSGVGEKTARKLVDEFGEDTLSVIDENPRRVESLLPKHRAEAVLQARAVERQSEEGAGAGGDRD